MERHRFTLSLSLRDRRPRGSGTSTLENTGTAPVVVDLVYAQDLALAHYGAVRMNEYYVSQYVDYTPLAHARAARCSPCGRTCRWAAAIRGRSSARWAAR